jgi:uncharacterized membrane protein YedE/YeeE
MRRHLSAFASGLLFALGLAVSGMTRPSKVLGFLDVSGHWDPSLALVMAGAVAVYALAFRLSRRMQRPVVAGNFVEPAASRIDPPLVLGALIFGAGWALAGYCPGPAFAALGAGIPKVGLFVGAMLAGTWLARIIRPHKRAESSTGALPSPELPYRSNETG